MGKIRVAVLGDEKFEKKQRKRAERRRMGKRARKEKVEGVGLKGGERIKIMEEQEVKKEIQELLEKPVEETEKAQEPEKKQKIKRRIRSKKYLQSAKLVKKNTYYPLKEAVALIKKTSITRFDGTVGLNVNIRTEKKGEKKTLQGSIKMPHPTGKQTRVAVLDDKLLEQISQKKIDFDILIAHPSLMSHLAKYAKILGPKGLMPNPKNKTISQEPEKRAEELRKGDVNYKTEPDNPIVHLTIGKVSMDEKKLEENIEAVLRAIGKKQISKATLSATMGPGIKIAL